MKWIILILMLFIYSISRAQFSCGDTLIDTRDGSNYRTVLIGNSCWMQQNLNYGRITPSFITASTHSDMHNDGIAEKYGPDGDSLNTLTYGGIYEWDELMDYNSLQGGRGLCPAGWHVPTDAEWLNMLQSAGADIIHGTGGNSLKETGQGFGSGAGTNSSGFSAKAAGDRGSFGEFNGLGLRFIFWTSTETAPDMARHFTLWAENDTIERLATQKITGLSCRCVQDSLANDINELNKENDLIIYPNPANEIVFIKNYSGEKIISVSIYDPFGRENIKSNNQQINVSELANGFYNVDIKFSEGFRIIKKLMILR